MKTRWTLPFFVFSVLLFSLSLSSFAQDTNPGLSTTSTTPSNTLTVLKSRAELDQMLAQGPNILDQLTPYSRKQLLHNVEWRNGAISRFAFAIPIAELEQEQARQVYAMFGIERFFPKKFPVGSPLRYDDVGPAYEALVQGMNEALNLDQEQAKSEDLKMVWSAMNLFYKEQLSPLLKPSKLASTSKGNLLVLFETIDTAVRMTDEKKMLEDLKRIHKELNHRGLDTRRNLDELLLKHMLTQRDLEGARALVAGRPHLSHVVIPKLLDAETPKTAGLTVFAEKNGQLQTKVLPAVIEKTQVLLVVSEHCGFCQKLFADLEHDSQLSARFSHARIILISALENGIPMDFVRQWNAKNPALPMYMPGKEEQWKSIDVNSWPQFVFMKNGKVQSRLRGWRNDGSSKENIIRALEKAGL